MNFAGRHLLLLLCSILGCNPLTANGNYPIDINLLPSNICYGKLDNGLTYYICPIENKTNTADFYLLQKVGSILEEEDQRGLAHFLEHMAFNGTRRFPGRSMIDYLERKGLVFGNDINAYTSFDETVYNISNMRLTGDGALDSCIMILRDWSGSITLDGREIDAERKIIHEEWRSKRGVRDRIYEKTLPLLFPDSNRYAYRMPIGLMSVVDNFPHKALRDYYHKWYRPDLQAVIIAGNVDTTVVVKKIREQWKDLPLRKNTAMRTYFTVADNQQPIVAVATDKELAEGTLRLSYKYNPLPSDVSFSIEGKRQEFMSNIITTMLMQRVGQRKSHGEIAQGVGMSFFDGDYSIARTKKAFSATARFDASYWQQAMQLLVYELKSVMDHGFVAEEYQNLASSLNSQLSSLIHNPSSSNSHPSSIISHPTKGRLIEQCKAHFLLSRPLLTDTDEAKLCKFFLETVTLDDINKRFGDYLYTQGGLAILLQLPSDAPSQEEVIQAYGKAWGQTTVAFKPASTMPRQLLMPVKPQSGTILSQRLDKLTGALILTLSNGATCILKNNPHGSGELRLMAISAGGTSMIPDAYYNHFSAINTLPGLGGLGSLTNEQVGRALEGTTAAYKTNITALAESFSGSCDVKDTEDLLQMLYLRFTTARKDTAAFKRWQVAKRKSIMQTIENPMTLFGDTLRNMMYNPHPRSRNTNLDLVDSVDYDMTCRLYLERFADASDFTFIFVGNINTEFLTPLICQYIASLPTVGKGRHEEVNLAALPTMAKGSRECLLEIPMQEPRTTVVYNIMERCKYTERNNIACAILNSVMDTRCTSLLREEQGGTYGVSVVARISRQPKQEVTMMFNFTSNAQQAKPLLESALKILKQIASEGVTTDEFEKARQQLIKQHDVYRNSNAFWLNVITQQVTYGYSDTLSYNDALQHVKPADVVRMARLLSKSKNTVELIMNGKGI